MGACVEMGNFLRLVLRNNCDSPEQPDLDVYVDFENPQPTETELEIYQLTESVLDEANRLLDDISNYENGATKVIRDAITNPADTELQTRAWSILIPLIHRLKDYFEFSLRLEQIIPLLLWELCSGPLPPVEQLESRQALAKQFAQLLDFVSKFDGIKLATPAIQNDFSYYRRVMSKGNIAYGVAGEDAGEVVVSMHEANTLSLFYAQSTPMLSALVKSTIKFVEEHPQLPVENTTDMLSTMAAVCRTMAENKELVATFANEDETVFFCLRVMVALIILYDHVHPVGVFARPAVANLKAAVRVLKSRPADDPRIQNLMNALRYTTKHLNDSSTPKNVKAMLV